MQVGEQIQQDPRSAPTPLDTADQPTPDLQPASDAFGGTPPVQDRGDPDDVGPCAACLATTTDASDLNLAATGTALVFKSS